MDTSSKKKHCVWIQRFIMDSIVSENKDQIKQFLQPLVNEWRMLYSNFILKQKKARMLSENIIFFQKGLLVHVLSKIYSFLRTSLEKDRYCGKFLF